MDINLKRFSENVLETYLMRSLISSCFYINKKKQIHKQIHYVKRINK